MPYHIKKISRSGFKVVDDKGREYSKKNLSKKRAEEQLKALYAKDSSMDKEGRGFFADVYDKVKRIGRATASAVRSIPSIRRNYPPNARQVLTEYGDGVITGLTLRREPIMGVINTVINYITNNQWDRAKKQANYDELYHLGLVITIQKGGVTKNILIEKNEVVNVSTEFSQSSKVQLFVLPAPSQPTTLQQFLDKGLQAMGDKFFLYDAFSNNCQAFIAGILRANGMLTPDAEAFIVQPLQTLLKGLPRYTPLVARAITDLASLGNRIILGEGKSCCSACSVGKSCKSASGKHEIATRGMVLRPRLVHGGVDMRVQQERQEQAHARLLQEMDQMEERVNQIDREMEQGQQQGERGIQWLQRRRRLQIELARIQRHFQGIRRQIEGRGLSGGALHNDYSLELDKKDYPTEEWIFKYFRAGESADRIIDRISQFAIDQGEQPDDIESDEDYWEAKERFRKFNRKHPEVGFRPQMNSEPTTPVTLSPESDFDFEDEDDEDEDMEGGSNLQKLADMNRAMKRELAFAKNIITNKGSEILRREQETGQPNIPLRQEYQQLIEAYRKMNQDLRTKTYPEIQEEVQDDPFDKKQEGKVVVAEKGSLRRGQGKGKKKPKENPYALGVRKKTRGSLTSLARAVQERTASLQAFRGIRDDVKDLQDILGQIQQSYANPVIEGEPNQEDVSIQDLRRRFAERQTELKAEHQRAQQKLNELADEVAIQNREDYASGQRQAYQKERPPKPSPPKPKPKKPIRVPVLKPTHQELQEEQAKKAQKGNGKPKKKKGGMSDPKDQEGKREPRRPPPIQIPARQPAQPRSPRQQLPPVTPPPAPPASPSSRDQTDSPPAKRQRRGQGKKPKGIQKVVESKEFDEGAFTKQAKRAKMELVEFAKHVVANPTKFQAKTRQRAQFILNVQKKYIVNG